MLEVPWSRAQLVSTICVVAFSSCSATEPGSEGSVSQVPVVSVTGDRELPQSLGDLAVDSALVIRAEATGEIRSMKIADTVMPVHTFKVVETVTGETTDTVEVVVGYAAYDYSTGTAVEVPFVQKGWQYILYLRPLDFGDGISHDEYVTVDGPAGVFVRAGSGPDYQAIDGEFPLGRSITLEQVRSSTLSTPPPSVLST